MYLEGFCVGKCVTDVLGYQLSLFGHIYHDLRIDVPVYFGM